MPIEEKEKLVVKKGELNIVITYTGEQLIYGEDEDTEAALWGNEVEKMVVVFPDKQEVDITEKLPQHCRLIGPVEVPLDYDNEESYISFGDLGVAGSMLHLLHEIGHAAVNERYGQSGYTIEDESSVDHFREQESKKERHAWGWALLMLSELKRQGKDLEPLFQDKKQIKEYIKESLLSHEVFGMKKYFLGKKTLPDGAKELKFWKTVDRDYLDRYIDELYEQNEAAFDERTEPKREFKNIFKLK